MLSPLTAAERMLIKRYLLPGKSEAFIMIVATFSLIAVMLGVAALIIILSVMNGFRAELFDKFVGLNGHAVIQGYNGRLDNWQDIVARAKVTPGVTSATPMVEQPLMAGLNNRVQGVLLRGMTPADIANSPSLKSKDMLGHLEDVTPGSGNIALGAGLADALGAQIGSNISIISPQGQTTSFGTVPRIVNYHVVSIFKIGVYDFDKAYAVIPLSDAQNMLNLGNAVSMIEVNTVDADNVGRILEPLTDVVEGKGVISDWRQTNGALFQAMALDRIGVSIVASLVTLVALFNIVSSLIMLVRAKTRDIAVLRTMGMAKESVARVFVCIGMVIGGLGVFAGLLFAGLVLTFLSQIVDGVQRLSGQKLWDPSIRFLTQIPTKVDAAEIIIIVCSTLLACFFFTLYPAYRAAKTDPVTVLRYE